MVYSMSSGGNIGGLSLRKHMANVLFNRFEEQRLLRCASRLGSGDGEMNWLVPKPANWAHLWPKVLMLLTDGFPTAILARGPQRETSCISYSRIAFDI